MFDKGKLMIMVPSSLRLGLSDYVKPGNREEDGKGGDVYMHDCHHFSNILNFIKLSKKEMSILIIENCYDV